MRALTHTAANPYSSSIRGPVLHSAIVSLEVLAVVDAVARLVVA